MNLIYWLLFIILIILIVYFIWNNKQLMYNINRLHILQENMIDGKIDINNIKLIKEYFKKNKKNNILSNLSKKIKNKKIKISNHGVKFVKDKNKIITKINKNTSLNIEMNDYKNKKFIIVSTFVLVDPKSKIDVKDFINIKDSSISTGNIYVNSSSDKSLQYDVFIPFTVDNNKIDIKLQNKNLASAIEIYDFNIYKLTRLTNPVVSSDIFTYDTDISFNTKYNNFDISKKSLIYKFKKLPGSNKNKQKLFKIDISGVDHKYIFDISNDIIHINLISSKKPFDISSNKKLDDNKEYLITINKDHILYYDITNITKPLGTLKLKKSDSSYDPNIDTDFIKYKINVKNEDTKNTMYAYESKNITKFLPNLQNSNNYTNLKKTHIILKSNKKPGKHHHKLDKLHKMCYTDCKKQCRKLLNEDDIGKSSMDYLKCQESCRYTVPNCFKMCNTHKLKNDPYCIQGGECPTAYKKGDIYYIHTSKKSIYCKNNKYGEKAYGKNRERVKRIYEKNYPDCPIPSALKKNNNLDKCPFVINNNNPCYSNECNDVDWAGFDDKSNMNQQCKNNVYNYCLTNKDIDENCICWSDVMKYDAKCSALRRSYLNEDDIKCNISEFKIQSHPDFYKYIQKDDIPCWNCNIPIEKPDIKSYKKFANNN